MSFEKSKNWYNFYYFILIKSKFDIWVFHFLNEPGAKLTKVKLDYLSFCFAVFQWEALQEKEQDKFTTCFKNCGMNSMFFPKGLKINKNKLGEISPNEF